MKKCWVFLAVIFLVLSSNAGAVPSNALPNGGSVAAGNATITQSSNHLQVNQQSQKAIINWKSFNIGSNASTHFQQPTGGVALNRINPTQGASQIFGRLTATGKIILVNQAGIYFGPGAYVNVGGIIASTSDISNANFLSGNYVFDKPSTQNGAIVNKGTIIAKENGLVALIGSGVSNEGLIQARTGNVVLASGNKFTVSLSGDQLINFTVDEGSSTAAIDANGNKLKNAVNNSGRIIADGGTVVMTAEVARGIVDRAINMSGVVEARSVAEKDGVIILEGGQDSSVVVAGKMDVSGDKGGTIKILGDNVILTKNAELNANGNKGGGTILVGGNKQGQGAEYHAKNTTVEEGAILSANASQTGNGGNIIVWSDGNTLFYGTANAKGGSQSGNGGFIETSGHYLDVTGATVDTSAAHGSKGTWLLDPTSIYIANNQANATAAGMSGVDTTANAPTSPTTYNASGNTNDSLVLVSTLQTALANNNVIVTTANTSGSGTGDITVVDPITWSSANSLTLSAYRNIVLNADITNSSNSSASVKLQADNTGIGTGTIISTPSGFVSLAGGSSQVNIYYNPTTFGVQDTLYSGGTTPTQYMLINTLGNAADTTTRSLASVSNNTALWGENFALSADIDASATSTWNAGSGFLPIGNNGSNFTGNFDGLDHVISNLFINATGSGEAGLFGYTSGSTLANVGLTNASVTATVGVNQFNVGILVGIAEDNSRISNVYTTGSATLNGQGRIGGIVGINDGTLINSASSANVNATLATGEFGNVGGLVGLNHPNFGLIDQSYSTGTITVNSDSTSTNAGGVAGSNQGTIQNSYSTSPVNVILTPFGAAQVGGIAGQSDIVATIDNVYSNGLITVTGGGLNFVGGILGFNNTFGSGVNNSAWDINTTGQGLGIGAGGSGSNVIGGCFGSACAPNDLSQASTYQSLGWNIGAPGSGAIWQIVDGVIYPHLISEGLHTVSGTVYSDNGVTPVGSGVTVNLAMNGAAPLTTTTDSSGQYSYLFSTTSLNPVPSGNVPIGTDMLIYASSGSSGNRILEDNGQTASSADLLNNQIIAGVSGGSAVSNAILANALGSLIDPNIGYSLSGNNVIIGSGKNFLSAANYILDGNLSTTNGDITLSTPTISLAVASATLSTNVGDISITGDVNGTGKALTLQGVAANADTFTLNNSSNALSSLTVSGGANTTTLSVQNNLLSQDWTVDGAQGGSITGITGIATFNFSNIGNLIGGNNLTASNTANTWTLTGSNTGSLATPGATYGFSGFSTLTGGSNSDSFVNNGGFTGTINGGAGTNTINMGTNPATTTWFISGANLGSGGGLTGFSNIQNIIASSSSSNNVFTIQTGGSITSLNGGGFANNNTLVGPNTDSTWVVNGAGSGSITSPITTSFSGFSNITGGTGANNFTINAGADIDTLEGGGSSSNSNTFNIVGGNINTLNGGAGPNNFLITSPTNPVTFDFNSDNSGSISGGATIGHFTQIPNISSTTSGDTINISSSVGNISVGDNTTVVITGTGNVGTLNGGNAGTYTISGIIGTLNGGSGTNTYILNNGANITNLVGGGSGTNNTLSLNTSSANTWNVSGSSGSVSGGATISNYSTISNLIGSNNGDTFNVSGTLNSITGGSGNDTFSLSSSAIVSNINGGSGNNILQLLSGSSTWNITGTNSGNLSGVVSAFSNISGLRGSSDGIATFKFFGPYFISIDGGNTNQVNVVDVSSVSQPINIVVGPKTGSLLHTGTLRLSDDTPFASFTRIQRAVGNGGILTTNPLSLLDSLVLTGTNEGYISDPFFFSGFTPMILSISSESNISNIITGSTDSNALLLEQMNDQEIVNLVNDNLMQMINNEIQADTDLTSSNTYCFQ